MRIAIVGAGAVGVVMGVSLEHGKHEITYLVRRGRKAGMKQLLLVHASTGATRCRERPIVAELGDKMAPFENALLCVRGDQAREAMEIVNQHLPPTCAVGVAAASDGSLDELRALHPGGPVYTIVPMFSAWSEENSVWRWFLPPLVKTMVSGEGDAKADAAATELAAALTAVGIPAKAIPSLRKSLATPFAAGLALLAGWELASWDLSSLAGNRDLRKLTGAAMAEAARLAGAEAEGIGAKLLAHAPGSALGLLLAAMPRLVPKNAHAMWRNHGPKIRTQTRAQLDALLAHADPGRVARLAELRRRLPAIE
jgi:ketopantoate reductase